MTVRINKTISVLKLGPLGQPTGLPKNCALFSSGSFYFKSKFPSVWPNTKKLAKKTKQIILTFSAETLGRNLYKRPVVSIVLFFDSELKQLFQYETHLIFQYCPTYKTWTPNCKMLQLGENHFTIKEINKTETVFLERTEYENAFRIIPQTNLLDEKAKAFIDVVSLKQLSTVDFRVNFYLTSLENSLGYIFGKWNDGEYLRYEMEKNSAYYFIIKPEKYYYLPQTSKCQKESYHECISLELEKLDFNQTSCAKKCMPSIFSYGNNSTSICQNLEEHECAKNVAESIIDKSIANYSTKPKFAWRRLRLHLVKSFELNLPIEPFEIRPFRT